MSLDSLLDMIINGQRTEMLKHLSKSEYDFEDLMQHLVENEMLSEVPTIVRIAIAHNYLEENGDKYVYRD